MYYLSRCGGADLSRGQVRAAAVAGVVEAEEGVARTRGHQLRGERVEAARVVQPAVQRQPLRAGGRTFATIIEIIISDLFGDDVLPYLPYSPRPLRRRWSTACPL